MVKVIDIESLLKKYMKESNLEQADALYLLFAAGPEEAAKTLRARYKGAGSLSSVLKDLEALGITDRYVKTEDTGEYLSDVVLESFKRLCLDNVIEVARSRATTLSRVAREIFYILFVMRHEPITTYDLSRFYRLAFQKTLDQPLLERALDELKSCYLVQCARAIQYVSTYIDLPPYLDDLLHELKDFMPKVEVRVSWPERKE